MTSQIDPGTLGWVKSEIDESLKQARLALESFAENPADDTRLRFCITHLHQVVGTLKMVELDGVAQLAGEIEALAQAILDEQAKPSEQVLETLSKGILFLPDYLARLQFGQADNPLRFLPLVNELRRGRRVKEISELDLFSPDLSVRPPRPPEAAALSEDEFSALARSLRHSFQVALLNWLRGPGNRDAVGEMGRVLDELEQQAPGGFIAQLFWVANGLVEAIAEGGLEATAERRKLFARLDQQIKKFTDQAERSGSRSASEALVKEMLFHVAQAGDTPRVARLKQVFNLKPLLAAEEQVAGGEQDLPAPEVLRSVSTALGKEVETAQDLLTAYFDPRQPDPGALARLQEELHKISGTLDMLGVVPLKTLVDEIIQACQALADGTVAAADTTPMVLAEGLLLLEKSSRDILSPEGWKAQLREGIAAIKALRNPGEAGVSPGLDGIEVSDAALTAAEYRQLLLVVGGEIRANLSLVEQAFEAFAADTASQVARLAEIPPLLTQVQGALEILGQDRAAGLADTARRYIQDLQRGALTADARVLDGIAMGIGTLGAYVDGLQANRLNVEGLIDLALNEMDAATQGKRRAVAPRPDGQGDVPGIGAALKAWLRDPSDGASLDRLRADLQALAREAGADGRTKVEMISQEMIKLLDIVADDPSELSDDITATLEQSFAALGAPAQRPRAPATVAIDDTDGDVRGTQTGEIEPGEAAAKSAPAPRSAGPASEPEPDDMDAEIIEIFIEDARDALATIKGQSDVWRDNPSDAAALAEMRRGYHTLKGSGRMVGASAIAELAWAVENALNKVREGRVQRSDALLQLLQEVQDVLPDMIAQLAGGPVVTADIDALRARADALARGEAPVAAPTPAAVPAVRSLPALDATLLQIFTSEAYGHLDAIKQAVAQCRSAGGDCAVTEGLFRATHTLGGSARSLGLDSMAAACSEAEKLLQELQLHQGPLSEAQQGLFTELTGCVGGLVQALNAQASELDPDLRRRFAELTARLKGEVGRVLDAQGARAGPVPEPPAAASGPAAGASPPPRAETVVEERIDPELLEIFLEEASDLLHAIGEALTEWRRDSGSGQALQDLKRQLHTLKGGARMAGAMTMGNLSHSMESLLKHVEDKGITANAELFDLLDEAHDTLVTMLDRMQAGQPVRAVDALNARLSGFMTGVPAPAPREAAHPVPPPVDAEASVEAENDEPDLEVHDRRHEAAADEPRFERLERRDQVRVRTHLLNDLVNYAGEVSISRARMEQQVYGFRENLAELRRNVTRFRDQLRELDIQAESQILYRAGPAEPVAGSDFDPLEFDRFTRLQQLSRGLTESLHDLNTIQGNLDNFVGEAETVLQQQARINTELQEGLMRTRMINFSSQGARLRHIVRQTARELGKRADLDIAGTEVEVDRTVLDRMIGPFEHMIRNAIDHGIEDEQTRKRAGKPPVGHIAIDTSREGNEIVIRFSDDGAGLDIVAIRKAAVERGLMEQGAGLSNEEIMQFILLPGFSTAKKVTHVSGRGVGMDVVHNEVKQLGGSMTVETSPGKGTTFVIRLPLTLSITQALMVYVGDQTYAVPLNSVVNIIEGTADNLSSINMGKTPLLNHNDQVYPFMHLGTRLGIKSQPRNSRKIPVLLARTGTRQVAIQVDGLAGTREVVIKPLGAQLGQIKGLAGATILGDGTVLLILDIPGLWLAADEGVHIERLAPAPEEPARPAASRRPVVMVVDDSLTVRKVTSRHLSKRGMDALVAKDGIDALEQLRDHRPDVMLVDIEMPRMDGYELTSRVRSDPDLGDIPIIMITSRAGGKHRQRAFDLGVDRYMSKPYQEDDLFQNIEALLARGRHGARDPARRR